MRVATYGLLLMSAAVALGAESASVIKAIPLPGASAGPSSAPIKHRGPEDIDTILRNWHRAKSKVERFDADFDRITWDRVFEVTQLSHGSLALDTHGRGFIKSQPQKVEKDVFYSGHRAVPGDAQHWCWTDEVIYRIDHHSRQYERLIIPREDGGALASTSKRRRFKSPPDRPDPPPLPVEDVPEQYPQFMVGWFFDPKILMPPEFIIRTSQAAMLHEFEVKLVKQAANGIYLDLWPTSINKRYQGNVRKISLLLSSEGYELKAIKLFDLSGNKTDTYVFNNRHFNERFSDRFPSLDAPPNLSGYKQLVQPFWGIDKPRAEQK